jgi:hypothetical protein
VYFYQTDAAAEYPQLAALLARADLSAHAAPLDFALCEQLGVAGGLAYTTALHDLEGEPEDNLIRCDPVHLHADPNKVLLLGPEQLDLDNAEADLLLTHLQHEFPDRTWRRGAEVSRWYVTRPPEVIADGPPTRWLSGRSLTPFLATDAAHRGLRRWLNDVQMSLHDHPVNLARVTRGALPINGVWMFGEGRALAAATADRYCIGNDVLLAGLAQHRQLPHVYESTAREALLACGSRSLVLVAGGGFGVADRTRGSLTLETLDRQWCSALLTALRTRRFSRLDFYTASHVARLSWRASWRLWRKPITFDVAR